jgi:hypothetical protein
MYKGKFWAKYGALFASVYADLSASPERELCGAMVSTNTAPKRGETNRAKIITAAVALVRRVVFGNVAKKTTDESNEMKSFLEAPAILATINNKR